MWTGNCWVGPKALFAKMQVAAPIESASVVVIITTDLLSCCTPSVSWWRYMHAQLQLSGVWEPSNQWGVRIYRAVQTDVVLAQTVGAPRDSFCPARECLIIQARVGHRPIKVFSCQGLPPKLAIVGNPCCSLIVPCCSQDRGLVCPEFWGLFWETGDHNGSHARVTL